LLGTASSRLHVWNERHDGLPSDGGDKLPPLQHPLSFPHYFLSAQTLPSLYVFPLFFNAFLSFFSPTACQESPESKQFMAKPWKDRHVSPCACSLEKGKKQKMRRQNDTRSHHRLYELRAEAHWFLKSRDEAPKDSPREKMANEASVGGGEGHQSRP